MQSAMVEGGAIGELAIVMVLRYDFTGTDIIYWDIYHFIIYISLSHTDIDLHRAVSLFTTHSCMIFW